MRRNPEGAARASSVQPSSKLWGWIEDRGEREHNAAPALVPGWPGPAKCQHERTRPKFWLCCSSIRQPPPSRNPAIAQGHADASNVPTAVNRLVFETVRPRHEVVVSATQGVKFAVVVLRWGSSPAPAGTRRSRERTAQLQNPARLAKSSHVD